MKKALLKVVLFLMVFTSWTTIVSAKEVKLIFATGNTSMAHLNVQVLHPWAQRVNEQGKGIIRIDVRDGFTLINHVNFYQRVNDNVVQIAFGTFGSAVAGKFKKTIVTGLPYVCKDAESSSVAFWRLYKSGIMDDEYDEIVPLFLSVLPQASLHFAKPIKSLDDFGGLKIAAGSNYITTLFKHFGMTTVAIPIPDLYEALQRGTVDGVSMTWTAFAPFKLAEVTKYHIDTRLGGSPGEVFMTKKVYNALPAKARKILEDNSGEAQSRFLGKFWDRVQNEASTNVARLKGHEMVSMTPAQEAEWKKQSEIIIKDWVNDTPNGEEVITRFSELIRQVEAGK